MHSFSAIGAAVLAVTALANAGDQQILTESDQNINPPLIGFGTWNLKVSPENTTEAVSLAIQTGYRHIDAAAAYTNQVAVGKGIADGLEKAGLRREEIWVTSKLWNDRHGDEETVGAALAETLLELELDYLDLYLMHWPVNASGDYDYVKTWQSMEKLVPDKARNIGVSNFSPRQLDRVVRTSTIKPAVHQMELHPYLQQEDWVHFHQTHGIHVTAYSPLGNTNPAYRRASHATDTSRRTPLLLENPELQGIAEQRNCTVAQVTLAWGIQRGTSVIPKSSHEEWIKEDFQAVECGLLDADLHVIEMVGKMYRTRFNNPSKVWGVHLFEGLEDS